MRNDLHRVPLSSIKWNNSNNIKGPDLLRHFVSRKDKYTVLAGPKPQMTNNSI